jgi:hypothetical protein
MRLEEAVHVTHGDSSAASLRQLGARNVIVWRDLLTVGRCALDPEVHRAARAAQWNAPAAGWEDLERALAQAGPLCVWASPSWSDSLYLWCLVDTLERLGVARAGVTLARPRADDPTLSLGALSPEQLRAGYDAAAPLDAAVADEAIALWHRFASPSPLAFDQARRAGSQAFPSLSTVGEGHGAWFPQRAPDGKLRLSDADQRLLGWIEDDWTSAVDLLKTPEARRPVRPLMNWIGDFSLFARIAAFGQVGAVEVRGEYRGPGRANDFAARLTSSGKRLRDEGAVIVAEMAPMWIGGCYINTVMKPWVRVPDGDGYRIVAG